MTFNIVYFVVSDTRQMALLRSRGCVQSIDDPLQRERISTIHDGKAATNVVWTTVHKRKLVELVDELTTSAGDKSCCQFQDAMSLPIPSVHKEVAEHRRDKPSTPGDFKAIGHDSTSSQKSHRATSFKQSGRTQAHDQHKHRAFQHEQGTSLLKNDPCKDLGKQEEVSRLSPAISACPAVPKNHDVTAAKISPAAARTSKPMSGVEKPEKAPQKVLRGSSEVWTSVDKTLVEDLFDQLLRSFDDVKVSRPETDRAGSGGSRGSLSDDVTNGLVDGGLWQSVAYKWKSHILLRMHSQQVARRALCRKRPYVDDRQLVQNSAF